MDTETRRLRERIEAVDAATASETDLVTVAVPSDGSVGEMLERIEEDHAEAEYIDTDAASGPLRDALARVRRVLNRYDRTPDTGLVVYAGEVEGEGLTDYVFDDLPTPVEESVYATDNEFDTSPLERVAGAEETYGLVVVERGGAALGYLEGEHVRPEETFESGVMGKTRAGGQSADRFERRREEQKESFFQEVADEAERAFLGEVDGLLLGGTTVTVEQFRDGEYLDHRLRDAVLGDTFSVEYANEQGLRQLADRAGEHLELAHREARAALERFYAALDRDAADGDGEPVAYGRDAVDRALEYDAVDTALLSESLPVEALREYERRAVESGGDVVVVPVEMERGEQFAEAFGGVGALLRFPVDADAAAAESEA